MAEPAPRRYLRFQAKVLLPVLAVMVLLLAFTMWAVNRRFSLLIETQATRMLSTVNQNLTELRTRSLMAHYANVPNQPRVKSIAQLSDEKTTLRLLEELKPELGSDQILFSTPEGVVLTRTAGDPRFSASELETQSIASVKLALTGKPNVDRVRAGDQIFSVVSLPVTVSGQIIGAMSFCDQIDQGTIESIKQFARSEVIVLAKDGIVNSTLATPQQHNQLLESVRRFSRDPPNPVNQGPPKVERIILNGEPFLALSSCYPSLSGDRTFGYMLLSSYGEAVGELRTTQRTLAAVSLVGILLSSLAVWLLVRTVTQPLRELQHATEALGRGDFSQRVKITNRDECGDLAGAFNQMIENLKSSREELEKTVETLKLTQAQLIQSEKLAGLGQFVAGVSHELNNPLTAIIGHAEWLKESKIGEEHRGHVNGIVAGGRRCAKIVQGLLSFARHQPQERAPIDVNEALEAALQVVQYTLHTANIQVVREFKPHLPKVLADGHQLQQVFLNIITNAYQALEGYRQDPRLRVATESAGNKVKIVFEDNGPGVAPENLPRLFDPFFTTRGIGQGTGLGLSLAYGIMQKHDGTITARSGGPGQGATFVVELPAMVESAAPPAVAAAAALPAADETNKPPPGTGKKVLVVDDEEHMLNLMRLTLEMDGYQVEVATDGETAMDLLRQTRYDVILSDWRMPGLNGRQVYEQLRASDPSSIARMVFMTGDALNDQTHSFLTTSGVVWLAKPFTLDQLRDAVGKVIQSE